MNSLDIIKQHIIKTLTSYDLSRKNKSLRAELGKIHTLADKLSKNNGWISVDDELPKQSGYYLVYGFDNFSEQCYAKIQHFSAEVTGFFTTDLDFEVEYWQALPQPPKE